MTQNQAAIFQKYAKNITSRNFVNIKFSRHTANLNTELTIVIQPT